MTTIKLGSKGEDVKKLQQILKLTVDGNFGLITDKKVKEWQKANGLYPDGIVGPKSWDLLLKTNNKPVEAKKAIPVNAKIVIDLLMSKLGLTKEQAAGICGVLMSESGINPKAYNKGEKNGTYKTSSANNTGAAYGQKHSPWSYGAGICQWTFTDRKEKALMVGLGITKDQAKRIIVTTGIENLPLEKQVLMLIGELKTTYKATLTGIKKCKTASQAAATYYCHSVAGYSASLEPATQAEINKMNAKYGTVGAVNQISKGMKYAESFV